MFFLIYFGLKKAVIFLGKISVIYQFCRTLHTNFVLFVYRFFQRFPHNIPRKNVDNYVENVDNPLKIYTFKGVKRLKTVLINC